MGFHLDAIHPTKSEVVVVVGREALLSTDARFANEALARVSLVCTESTVLSPKTFIRVVMPLVEYAVDRSMVVA